MVSKTTVPQGTESSNLSPSAVHDLNEEKGISHIREKPLARVAREIREKAKRRRLRVLAKLREVLAKAKEDGRARPKISVILASIAEGPETDVITIGELLHALNRRAFGFVLFFFGVVCVLPLPPGFSFLVGLPIFFFGFQLLLGRHRPWLPVVLRRRTFTRRDFARIYSRSALFIRQAESYCWPRLPLAVWFVSPYVVGGVVMALSLYIIAPVPFAGILPALAVVVIALALIENDGLMLLLGLIGAFAAIAVSTAIAAGTIYVVFSTVGHFLGL